MNVFHEFQSNDTAYLSVIGLTSESHFTRAYARILLKLHGNYKSYEIRSHWKIQLISIWIKTFFRIRQDYRGFYAFICICCFTVI